MDPQNPTDPAAPPATPPLMTLQILWIGLFFSILVYVGVAFFVPLGGEGMAAGELRMIELVLALVALSCLVTSFILPRRMLASAVPKGEAGADLELPKLVRLAASPWIVRMALCEAVATMGLVLAFLAHQPMRVVPFAALSALAMLTAFPTEQALRRAAQT